MKTMIWVAGLLAIGVLMLYAGLILGAGQTAIAQAEIPAPKGRIVPPLESLLKERQAEKTQKNVFHAKAAPPKVKIFQTSYKDGTQVTFNHEKHVEVHKLNCIECHHVERCSKCHLKTESKTMEVAKGKQAMHENCIGCHTETTGPQECQECHKQ